MSSTKGASEARGAARQIRTAHRVRSWDEWQRLEAELGREEEDSATAADAGGGPAAAGGGGSGSGAGMAAGGCPARGDRAPSGYAALAQVLHFHKGKTGSMGAYTSGIGELMSSRNSLRAVIRKRQRDVQAEAEEREMARLGTHSTAGIEVPLGFGRVVGAGAGAGAVATLAHSLPADLARLQAPLFQSSPTTTTAAASSSPSAGGAGSAAKSGRAGAGGGAGAGDGGTDAQPASMFGAHTTLAIGPYNFLVHAHILAARSPLFCDLLYPSGGRCEHGLWQDFKPTEELPDGVAAPADKASPAARVERPKSTSALKPNPGLKRPSAGQDKPPGGGTAKAGAKDGTEALPASTVSSTAAGPPPPSSTSTAPCASQRYGPDLRRDVVIRLGPRTLNVTRRAANAFVKLLYTGIAQRSGMPVKAVTQLNSLGALARLSPYTDIPCLRTHLGSLLTFSQTELGKQLSDIVIVLPAHPSGAPDSTSSEAPFSMFCHSSILFSRCPYVRTLLSGRFSEHSITPEGRICLELRDPSLNPGVLKMVMQYLYTGRLPLSGIPLEQAISLLDVSDYLLGPASPLALAASQHVVLKLRVRSVSAIAEHPIAGILLEEACDDFVCNNFIECATLTEGTPVDPERMRRVLLRDDLSFPEADILETVMAWAEALVAYNASPLLDASDADGAAERDPEEVFSVQDVLSEFLPLVRLPYVPTTHPAFRQAKEAGYVSDELVAEAARFQAADKFPESEAPNDNYRARLIVTACRAASDAYVAASKSSHPASTTLRDLETSLALAQAESSPDLLRHRPRLNHDVWDFIRAEFLAKPDIGPSNIASPFVVNDTLFGFPLDSPLFTF